MKPLLCYEATGTSREAILALDVRLVEVAAGSVVFEERRDVNVGRDGVALDLVDIEPGRYRLAVGLVVDGELSDGLTLEVPDLTLVEGTPAALCK